MDNKPPMTFGSLFCGIGGFDLGLEAAGMECKWQVEIADYPNEVLARHWPDVPKHRDIFEVGSDNLEPVNLIVGGFPCQPFSVAGKRRGEEDERHLWPEMLRVIQELQPAWVIGENVGGLAGMAEQPETPEVESRTITRIAGVDIYCGTYIQQEGMLLETICSQLEEINYEVQPLIIPAAAVGALHRRDRLWLLAHAKPDGRGGADVGNTEELHRDDRDVYARIGMESKTT